MGSSVSCCSSDTAHSLNALPRSRTKMIGGIQPASNNKIDVDTTATKSRRGFNLSNLVSDGDETTFSFTTTGANFNDLHTRNGNNAHHRAVDTTHGGSSSTPSLSTRMPLTNTTPNGSFPAVLGGGDNLECSMPGSVIGSLSINFSIMDGGSTNLGDCFVESNHCHAADSPSSARRFHPSQFRGGFSGGGSGRGGSVGRPMLEDHTSQSPPPKILTPPPTPKVGATNVNSVALQQQDLKHTQEDFILNNSSSSSASNRAPSLEHHHHLGCSSSSPLGGSISRKGRRVVRASQPPSPQPTPAVNPLSASASALSSLLQLSDTHNTEVVAEEGKSGTSLSMHHPTHTSQSSNIQMQLLGDGARTSSSSCIHLKVETPSLKTAPNQFLSTTTTAPLGGSFSNTMPTGSVGALGGSRNPPPFSGGGTTGGIGTALSGSLSQQAGTPKNTTVVPPSIRDFMGSSRSKSNSRSGGISGCGGLELSIVTPLNASDSEAHLAHSRRIGHIVGGVGPQIEISPAVGTNNNTMSLSEQNQQHLANLPVIRHRRSHLDRLWTPLSTHDSPGGGGRASHQGEPLQDNNANQHHSKSWSGNSENNMMVDELPRGLDAFQGGSTSSPESGSSSSIFCSRSMSVGAESSSNSSRRFHQKPHYESNSSSGGVGGGGGLTHSRTTCSAHSHSTSFASGAAHHHLDSLFFTDQLISAMSQAPPPHQLQGIFNCSRCEYHQRGHQRSNSSQLQVSTFPLQAMGTSPIYQPQPPNPRQMTQRTIRGAFEVDGRDKRLLRNN